MSYVPPNGGAAVLDLTGYAIRPPAASVNVEFDSATVGDIRQASVPKKLALFGQPHIRLNTAFVRLRGLGIPPPIVSTPGIRITLEQRLFVQSIADSSSVSAPEYVRWRRFLTPEGWVSNPIWPGTTRLRWLGGYQPPPAINTILNWTSEPYSPPPAANVILDFGALGFGRILGVTLFDQSAFGTTVVSRPLTALPSGWVSSSLSAPNIQNLRRHILGVGAGIQFASGTAALQNLAANLIPGSIVPAPQTGPNAQRRFPSPTVDLATRYLAVTPGLAPPLFPLPIVTHEIQFVGVQGFGIGAATTGAPTAIFKDRAVEPWFFVSTVFGTALVGRTVELAPPGWDSSTVSPAAGVEFRVDLIAPDSGAFDPARYGELDIRNRWQVVAPLPFGAPQWHSPVVYNARQEVFPAPYMGHVAASDVTQWPAFAPTVANRDREVQPFSWRSSRFSLIGNHIFNGARGVAVEGLDATLWGSDTSATHRHRELQLQGWESASCDPRFSVVYNAAQEIYPSPWANQSAVGRPDPVRNRNRTFAQFFPYAGSSLGTAFIAFRVRGIQVLFGAAPPDLHIPEVRRNPHPITPAALGSSEFGRVFAEERFIVIAPMSTNVPALPRIGVLSVVNRNRTVLPFPNEHTLWGRPAVSNYITYLDGITAGSQTIWGATLIRDRRTWLYPSPFSRPTFSVFHRIRNLIPDPPAQRTVILGGFQSSRFGGVVVSDRAVRVEGLSPPTVPAPQVRGNDIRVATGITTVFKFGAHSVVGMRQFVAPRAIPWPRSPANASSSDLSWGKPRLAPHTIYAPSSDQATDQARLNHPAPSLHRIDQGLSDSSGQWSLGRGWPWFGRPNAALRGGPVAPATRPSTVQFGTAELSLRRRFIQPAGRNFQRFGLVVFWGVPQYVGLDAPLSAGISPTLAFGATTVAPPSVFDPNVHPVGAVLTLWGASSLELLNREVAPVGIPHRGNPQQDMTNPWGQALVGFPREYAINGLDATLWGTTWVSHRIRTLPTQGWDSLSLAARPNGRFFPLRMRVRRINPLCIPPPILSSSTPPAPAVSFV